MAKGGWMAFVQDFRIPWVWGSGRRNIEIRCPKCNDGSMKLGLSLEFSGFGCWKNREHSGNSPEYLICSLTHMPFEEAKLTAKAYFDGTTAPKRQSIRSDAKPCNILNEFIEFTGYDHEIPFLKYVYERGLDPSYVIPRFKLRSCVSGKFQQRLIIPIIENYNWHTWVGRTIDPNQTERFKAAGSKETENKTIDYLFDIDNLVGGDLLVIVEGFFDSASITQAFLPGIAATCTFGKTLSPAQLHKLIQIAPRYKTIALGYDATAANATLRISNQLRWYINTPIKSVVPDSKDWSIAPRLEIRSKLECLIS